MTGPFEIPLDDSYAPSDERSLAVEFNVFLWSEKVRAFRLRQPGPYPIPRLRSFYLVAGLVALPRTCAARSRFRTAAAWVKAVDAIPATAGDAPTADTLDAYVGRCMSDAQMDQAREALLALHKTLLDHVRIEYEREHGRVENAGALLQLVVGDPAFEWLRPLSQLIVAIDELELHPSASRSCAPWFRKLVETDAQFSAPYQQAAAGLAGPHRHARAREPRGRRSAAARVAPVGLTPMRRCALEVCRRRGSRRGCPAYLSSGGHEIDTFDVEEGTGCGSCSSMPTPFENGRLGPRERHLAVGARRA